MPQTYDVTSFELSYCSEDLKKMTRAMKAMSSLLVIGMPGCGKSRLIDFLLHKPGALEKYELSDKLKFIRIDGDAHIASPQKIYGSLLRAISSKTDARPQGEADDRRHARRPCRACGGLDRAGGDGHVRQ